MKTSSGAPGSGRAMARASPAFSKAALTSPTVSFSRRTEPSPISPSQSCTLPAERFTARVTRACARAAGRPPSPSARAAARLARRIESSITSTVTVAPETMSTSDPVQPAAAFSMMSRPA